MKLLTKKEFESIASMHYDDAFEIIHEHSKILADIFDNKNQEKCSNCIQNYENHYKYKYEIKNGRRTRTRVGERVRYRDTGCCHSCAHDYGHFSLHECNLPANKQSSYTFDCYKRNLKITNERFDNLKKIFKFNEKTGFFNLELKSCNLPREFRSYICLKYFCPELGLNENESSQVYKSSLILKGVKKELCLPV